MTKKITRISIVFVLAFASCEAQDGVEDGESEDQEFGDQHGLCDGATLLTYGPQNKEYSGGCNYDASTDDDVAADPQGTVSSKTVNVEYTTVENCCWTSADAALETLADGTLVYSFTPDGICACNCVSQVYFSFEVCDAGDYTLLIEGNHNIETASVDVHVE